MKPTVILYTSNTGFTAQYAAMLSEQTGLPCFALKAAGHIQPGTPILYLGWLMAGNVQGYKEAAKKYRVCAVCGVGMGSTGSQIEDVRKTNALPADLPVFVLQGGFDMKRLHGVYKLMMTVMKNTVGKSLAKKPERTADEDTMLDLLQNGGSRVSAENLGSLLDWYFSQPVSE